MSDKPPMKYTKVRHALEASAGAIVALIEAGSLPPYLSMEVTNKETTEVETLTLMDIVGLATDAMAEEDEPAADPLQGHPELPLTP